MALFFVPGVYWAINVEYRLRGSEAVAAQVYEIDVRSIRTEENIGAIKENIAEIKASLHALSVRPSKP